MILPFEVNSWGDIKKYDDRNNINNFKQEEKALSMIFWSISCTLYDTILWYILGAIYGEGILTVSYNDQGKKTYYCKVLSKLYRAFLLMWLINMIMKKVQFIISFVKFFHRFV